MYVKKSISKFDMYVKLGVRLSFFIPVQFYLLFFSITVPIIVYFSFI